MNEFREIIGLAWLTRLAVVLLLTTSGCGVFFHSTSTQKPFTPSTDQGDLVIVRTGDHQFYYVVDKKRQLCFFHAKMYGRTHLVNLPCEDIPEYNDIMGLASANDETERPAEQPKTTASITNPAPARTPKAVSKSPPEQQAPTLDESQMANVKTAFNELQCNRRKGNIEPLETLLQRHNLSLDTWEQAMNELQATPERWATLHDEAAKSCAP